MSMISALYTLRSEVVRPQYQDLEIKFVACFDKIFDLTLKTFEANTIIETLPMRLKLLTEKCYH